jgi:hypothetical protein
VSYTSGGVLPVLYLARSAGGAPHTLVEMKMVTALQTETERAPRMSGFELSRTQEFSHLSAKMGRFVLAYVQGLIDTDTADPVAAVKFAYNTKNDESARTFGFQLLSNIKVILTLNRFFGVTPNEAFLKQVERAIYNPNISVAQVDALRLYSAIHGIEKTAVGVAANKAAAKNHGHKAEPEVSAATTSRRVPADAVSVWKDKNDAVIGYRDASGKDVQLG